MPDFQNTLVKLNDNLHILQQREAKYGGDAPVALLNQISDHDQAIALTEQVTTGDLTEAEWRQALKPLNIDHTLIEGGFFQNVLKALSLPTDQQRDLRNREIMLQRVHDFWVKGVLENSLHNEVLIELGMETKPEAVEYPWDMVIQRPGQPNRTLPSGAKMIDVFDESGGSLLILGEPGSGKTTMLLELARQLIAYAQTDPTQPIPVVFNLSSWIDRKQVKLNLRTQTSVSVENKYALANWLVNELNNKYSISNDIGRNWVENQDLLLLLDGLDEVKSEHREACVRAINDFRQEFGMTFIVVCSRTIDYDALTTRLSLRSAIILQPLTQQQIAR